MRRTCAGLGLALGAAGLISAQTAGLAFTGEHHSIDGTLLRLLAEGRDFKAGCILSPEAASEAPRIFMRAGGFSAGRGRFTGDLGLFLNPLEQAARFLTESSVVSLDPTQRAATSIVSLETRPLSLAAGLRPGEMGVALALAKIRSSDSATALIFGVRGHLGRPSTGAWASPSLAPDFVAGQGLSHGWTGRSGSYRISGFASQSMDEGPGLALRMDAAAFLDRFRVSAFGLGASPGFRSLGRTEAEEPAAGGLAFRWSFPEGARLEAAYAYHLRERRQFPLEPRRTASLKIRLPLTPFPQGDFRLALDLERGEVLEKLGLEGLAAYSSSGHGARIRARAAWDDEGSLWTGAAGLELSGTARNGRIGLSAGLSLRDLRFGGRGGAPEGLLKPSFGFECAAELRLGGGKGLTLGLETEEWKLAWEIGSKEKPKLALYLRYFLSYEMVRGRKDGS